jgi:hypothetical protein
MACNNRILNNTQNGTCESVNNPSQCGQTTDRYGRICNWNAAARRCMVVPSNCQQESCTNRGFNRQNGSCGKVQSRPFCNTTTDHTGKPCTYQNNQCIPAHYQCKNLCKSQKYNDTINGQCSSIIANPTQCHNSTDIDGYLCGMADGQCVRSDVKCETQACTDDQRTYNNIESCRSLLQNRTLCEKSTNRNGVPCTVQRGLCVDGNVAPCDVGIGTISDIDDKRYVVSEVGRYNINGSFDKTVRTIRANDGYNLCVSSAPIGNAAGSESESESESESTDKSKCTPVGTTSGIDISNEQLVARSYHLRKNCDAPNMIWDSDCKDQGYDSNRIINPCIKDSQCYLRKIRECNNEEGLTKSQCVDFCRSNNGACDVLMTHYCSLLDNKDKAECTCLNSPAAAKFTPSAMKYNPVCVDEKCKSGGYIPQSMTTKTCPSGVECDIYKELKDTGIQFTTNKELQDYFGDIGQRCETLEKRKKASQPQPQPAPGLLKFILSISLTAHVIGLIIVIVIFDAVSLMIPIAIVLSVIGHVFFLMRL